MNTRTTATTPPAPPPGSIGADPHTVRDLLAAGGALATPRESPVIHGEPGVPYAIVPDGYRIEHMRRAIDLHPAPHHIEAERRLHALYSWLTYVERFETHATALYVQLEPAQFVAVFDEHEPAAPAWRAHRAIFRPTHSRQWLAWKERDGRDKAFSDNVEFAEWLEDQHVDIVDPPGGAMLDAALQFRVSQQMVFRNAARLQDGHVQMEYSTVVEQAGGNGAAGALTLPERFTVAIPVFAGLDEPRYQLTARFRYRLANGGLRIWYQLERPADVVERAFRDMVATVDNGTSKPIMYGAA